MNQEPIMSRLQPGSIHLESERYLKNPQQNDYLKSIELWDESEESPQLLNYSHHEISITAIINMYKHIFERGEVQLKFVDFETGLTSYIDISKEFKNKILRQIKYCMPGVSLEIDKCKHKFQSPNESSDSNSE